MAIFNEPRSGYWRKKYNTDVYLQRLVRHTWNTTESSSFLLVLFLRTPLSTDVPVLLKSPHCQAGTNSHWLWACTICNLHLCSKFVENCSTFYWPVRTESFSLHIIVHFHLMILLCSSGQSSCSNWILLNHGVLNVKWQIFWKWDNRQGEAQRHQLAGNRYSHWGNTRKSE